MLKVGDRVKIVDKITPAILRGVLGTTTKTYTAAEWGGMGTAARVIWDNGKTFSIRSVASHYVNSREGAVSLSSHLPNWANKPFLGILQ